MNKSPYNSQTKSSKILWKYRRYRHQHYGNKLFTFKVIKCRQYPRGYKVQCENIDIPKIWSIKRQAVNFAIHALFVGDKLEICE